MDRQASGRNRRRVSRKGHGVPSGDGGAWEVLSAVSRLRIARAADQIRRERSELLRDLPDWRPSAGGSVAVAAAARGLAAHARRARTQAAWLIGRHPLIILSVA